MPRFRNAVGPQISRQRMALGLTQEELAARLQLLGLTSLDRVGVVKIETRIRSVFDFEIQLIAVALKTDAADLFPSLEQTKRELPDLRRGFRTAKR